MVNYLNNKSKRREATTGDRLPVLMRQTLNKKLEPLDALGQSLCVMANAIVIDKIDLSIFDKPREVKLPAFGSVEEQEMYEDNYRLELESEDYWDSLNDEYELSTYTYRLIGIKADGSDDIIEIKASSEIEAEIIIESFHDGDYILESRSDDYSFLGEFAFQITGS